MPSRNTYHLTWVSLTSDVVYLFMAAPAKRSHCCLPWTRVISSLLPLLTLNVEWLLLAHLCPCSHCSLDVALLLCATATDLGHWVAPPGRCPWPRERGSSSRQFLCCCSLSLSHLLITISIAVLFASKIITLVFVKYYCPSLLPPFINTC